MWFKRKAQGFLQPPKAEMIFRNAHLKCLNILETSGLGTPLKNLIKNIKAAKNNVKISYSILTNDH